MLLKIILFFISIAFKYGSCNLWPKGVVHYSISSKDYDVHSQDIISSTLDQIQKEICVKFFQTPLNYSSGDQSYKILYINNPDKRKSCPPGEFSFNNTFVMDLVIGYKCLNERDIATIIVEMLRASITHSVSPLGSYDLMKKFKSVGEDVARSSLLSPADRNFINAHYHQECGSLDKRTPLLTAPRRSGLRSEEQSWYNDKLWPLGVVMYTVDTELRGLVDHSILKYAMIAIELSSCVVFQFHDESIENVIVPSNLLEFGKEGEETAALGVKEGRQKINLSKFTHGAPGHTTHTINNLMRVLGIPMMSNRFDRDNYVAINWRNVAPGKGHYVEKYPEAAWIKTIPYDWASVTHAPANFMCTDCSLGKLTVQPLQDYLWQRTLSMGHSTAMTEGDKDTLYLLYNHQCRLRANSNHQD